MRLRGIVLAPLGVLGIVTFVFVGGWIVQLLWNWLLPPLFGWREVTFWQALGLLALCRILFGGFAGRGSPRSRIRRRMAERWERMTPEMQRVFGSASELGQFAGKAVTRLGEERRTVDEDVVDARAERVYSRTSAFSEAPQPMMIQWTLTESGAVSGLVVRPADSKSSKP